MPALDQVPRLAATSSSATTSSSFSSSFSSTASSLTTAAVATTQPASGGLGMSDKIAIGIGIGVGVPVGMATMLGTWFAWKMYQRERKKKTKHTTPRQTVMRR